MSRIRFAGVLLLWMTASAAHANTLYPWIEIFPNSVAGLPGSVVGWGFTIQGDPTNWIQITGESLAFETNSSVGTFIPYLLIGGPVDFAIPPLYTWTQSFSAAGQTGVGEFDIDPGAVVGSQDTGDVVNFPGLAGIVINYNVFSGDPSIDPCLHASDGCQLNPTPLILHDQNNNVPNFEVDVAPEPGMGPLIALSGLGLLVAGRIRRRRSML